MLPKTMTPEAREMLDFLCQTISDSTGKATIGELLKRFPGLGVLDPNAQAVVYQTAFDGRNYFLQQPPMTTTWAQIVKEQTDVSRILADEVRALRQEMGVFRQEIKRLNDDEAEYEEDDAQPRRRRRR